MPFQKICVVCGAPFIAKRRSRICCGQSCAGRSKGLGSKHYPTRNYKHAHRVAMENKLGRKLKRAEFIHHIDGNPHNFNIENLQVVTLAQHNTIHITKHVGCIILGCHKNHHAHGLCHMHCERARRRGLLPTQNPNNNCRMMIQNIESGAML